MGLGLKYSVKQDINCMAKEKEFVPQMVHGVVMNPIAAL
jgi:hypothetical protein